MKFKRGDWVIPKRNNPNNDVGKILECNQNHYIIESFIAGLNYGNISADKEMAENKLIVISKEVADILIATQPQ